METVTDKASHTFKHLQNSERCRALWSVDCFHILDHASTGFQTYKLRSVVVFLNVFLNVMQIILFQLYGLTLAV